MKTYQYLVARERYGKTKYFFNAGGKPKKEIPLGHDLDKAIAAWPELMRIRSLTISPARQTAVPGKLPRRTAVVSVPRVAVVTRIVDKISYVDRLIDKAQTTGSFIARPFHEIYINYVKPKGIATPFDLKAWNGNRPSIMNPTHPNFRR